MEIISKAEESREGGLPQVSPWTQHEKVALACRILSSSGHESGLSGQITARCAVDRYITQPLGFGFDEMTASSLLTVDNELNVIEGSAAPNPANRFHSWIYGLRPEVNCIVHTHPIFISSLSMLEVPLVISHMDSCALHGEVALLPKWPGVPVGNREGSLIADALGGKKAVLLGHHGLVTATSSIEESCVLALQLERAAQLQLQAMSAGGVLGVDPVLAEEAREWLSRPGRISITFEYYARKVLRKGNECLQ